VPDSNITETKATSAQETMGQRPDTFYHGTSIESALKIQAYGFDVALSRSSAGALLGPGVYCTTTLKKAMDYVEGKEADGIIFELQADQGGQDAGRR